MGSPLRTGDETTLDAVASAELTEKVQTAPSAGKVMITVFWDSRGVLLLDVLPKGETINSAQYQETLKKLARSIRLKRPDLQDVILHHDNA